MPTNDDIRLSLKIAGVGADDEIYFGEFRSFCNTIADCLKCAEMMISGGKPKIRYRLVNLEIGSARVELEAVRPPKGRDRRVKVLGLFRRTVKAIQSGKRLDPRVGASELEVFKRLGKPVAGHKRTVEIDSTLLTDDYLANADRILKCGMPVEGFVSGILERVNVHQRSEFVLFPPIEGYSIRCTFPAEMLDDVRRALKCTVTVSGSMRYEKERPFPSVVHVTKMEVHPADDDLPSLRDLKGFGAGCTGGLSAVDYVRAIRMTNR